MTTDNISGVQRKLDSLMDYLAKLEVLSQKSPEDFFEDWQCRFAAERAVHIVIECALDCCKLIIVGIGHNPPKDYSYEETFTEMGKLGVLTADLASELARYASLRNWLVHDSYEHSIVLIAFTVHNHIQCVARLQGVCKTTDLLRRLLRCDKVA